MRYAQLTTTVVMISPDQFGFNLETAASNVFQHRLRFTEQEIQKKALREFTGMVQILKARGITVLVLPSRTDVLTPDAVFPNNWFSHHQDGKLLIYPLLAPNRQAERQVAAVQTRLATIGLRNLSLVDFSPDEKIGYILEGTGSMVLDREHHVAFAMESPRTSQQEFEKWCQYMGYEGIFFHAYDKKTVPIYHTNVLMSIGQEFSVICLDAITDPEEKAIVEHKLHALGKQILPITINQMLSFCGNILQVTTNNNKPYIILSETALTAFTDDQREQLQQYGELIPVHIPTIETVGGGSARCMLAEIFAFT